MTDKQMLNVYDNNRFNTVKNSFVSEKKTHSFCHKAETSFVFFVFFFIINQYTYVVFLIRVYLCVRELFLLFKPLLWGFVANGFVKSNFIALL